MPSRSNSFTSRIAILPTRRSARNSGSMGTFSHCDSTNQTNGVSACVYERRPSVAPRQMNRGEKIGVLYIGSNPTTAIAVADKVAVETGGSQSPQLLARTRPQKHSPEKNDGPGLPKMERNVLTGQDEITPLYHGSGLGLWLVNLVVRRSDGQITVLEPAAGGTRVTIELPVAN
ncbi:ATP-binding protein [Halodesulfurarchaeum sp.]|uniref:ATP-binding protein n=1 Tax=Halodesulfurarchaeum sp. TaxID=1980530 RepID=UPI001BB81167|nr:ATP-binding protein [Halodesulfurarchaeum sp.]